MAFHASRAYKFSYELLITVSSEAVCQPSVRSLYTLDVGIFTEHRGKRSHPPLRHCIRCRYYVNGPGIVGSIGNHWHKADGWPTNVIDRTWYLEQGGRLSELPGDGLTERALVYDPADPHGTYGGDNLFISPCGPQDQTLAEATNESVTAYHALLNGRNGTKVTWHNGTSPCYNNSCAGGCLTQMQRLYKACVDSPRRDILRYTTKPLELPMTILGNVTASLEVSSNSAIDILLCT